MQSLNVEFVSLPAESLCILNIEQVRAVSRSPIMTPAAPSAGDPLAGVLNELAASPLRPARDISLAARLLTTACIPPLPPTFPPTFPRLFCLIASRSLLPPPAVSALASRSLTSFVLSFDFYPLKKKFNKLQESCRSLPRRSWHSVLPIALVFLSIFSYPPANHSFFRHSRPIRCNTDM